MAFRETNILRDQDTRRIVNEIWRQETRRVESIKLQKRTEPTSSSGSVELEFESE